jgi:hypothetical protein
MEHITVGAGIVILLCCAYIYVKRYRSCQAISTTEWVRLMRENDRASKAKATGIRLL